MTDRIRVGGLDFDLLTEAQVIEHVVDAIERGSGGTIVTPNIDICRRTDRDPSTRGLVDSASIVVPDGIPLLWAARLAGLPLVQRIAGADLIYSMSEAAAARSWPIYVLGGMPGEDGRQGAAEMAADRLAARYEGLKVAGAYSPPFPFDAKAGNIDDIRRALVECQPKVVFVGLGFPKQERLISRLCGDLPGTWFVGCGAAIPIAAGQLNRAHPLIQRLGLEWLHRLVAEPRRLAKRYLVHDLPYAVWLLFNSAFGAKQTPPRDSARNPAEAERLTN